MLTLRPESGRDHVDHGWLKSAHTFFYAVHHDPRHMGWGRLRVIDAGRIAPGAGFVTHGHRDMQIICCAADGKLAHRDSMGNGTMIPPGDVQRTLTAIDRLGRLRLVASPAGRDESVTPQGGDGLMLTDAPSVEAATGVDAEVLVFDPAS